MNHISHIVVLGGVFIAVFFTGTVHSQSPMNDAVAVWNMNDATDSSGNENTLTVVGNPTFGIALSEKDALESKQRSGDGKAVKISPDSYLNAGQGAKDALNFAGKNMSIYIRLQIPSGKWDFPILAKHGGHQNLAYNIYSSEDRIGCEIGTTMNKNFISATVPFSDMLPKGEAENAWHDVICRVNDAKLELFIDGRCVDEEFTLGNLKQNSVPLLIGAESYGETIKTGFDGLIDHVAIWDRALSNEEIITLSGGPEKADIRERTDRGIPGESLQYWRPPNNYFVGDCLPFYQDGVFHFAYLLDKGHHGAKGGFGAHQWVQATSTDFVNWKHQPFIVEISEQWEGSICTGSVFYHDKVYYAFYATRAVPDVAAPNGKKYSGEFVAYATSSDGIHFTKQQPNPLVVLPAKEGYSRAGRDPVVFQDEHDGLFHMYITSNFKGNGCWAHLTSTDLKDWELQKPVLSGGGDPECPDWFKWDDTYYLIVNWGNGYYRTAKTPIGPWEKPTAPDILMPGVPRVPKTAPYHDGRRIICGWTNEHGFGGHAVFHELLRNLDGTLGEKFVPEMIPKTGEPILNLDSNSKFEKTYADIPEMYRLQTVLEFDVAKKDSIPQFIMVYHQDASRKAELRIDPAKESLQLGQTKIEQVDFSTGKIVLDMFVKNGIVDLCIDDKRTVTEIIPEFPFRELTFENVPPEYKIQSLVVSPLK